MLLILYRWHRHPTSSSHAKSGNGFEEVPDTETATQYMNQLRETNKDLGYEMFTNIRLVHAEEMPVNA